MSTEYPRLRVEVGGQLTVTTMQNQTVTGTVAEVDEFEDGRCRAVAIIDDPQRDDPVWVRGDLIALWRLGRAVVQQVPTLGQNGIPQQVPQDVLKHLRGL